MFKHDFIGNTTLKKPLERSLYEKAAYNYGVMGDATIVTGPDVIRHITNARQTVCRRATDRICIVEIDKVVAEKQDKELQAYTSKRMPVWMAVKYSGKFIEDEELLPIHHNLYRCIGSIDCAKTSLFVDADLTATIKSTGHIIKNTLRKQRDAFPFGTPIKCFIFTFSVRAGGGLLENIDWVTNELIPCTGAAVTIGDRTRLTNDPYTRQSNKDVRGVTVQKYEVISKTPNILRSASLYYYNDDGGGMVTGQLLYS